MPLALRFTLGAAVERTEVQCLIDPKTVDVSALEVLVAKLEKASGPTHPHTLKALSVQLELFRFAGQFDKALSVAVLRADRTRKANGPDAELTLKAGVGAVVYAVIVMVLNAAGVRDLATRLIGARLSRRATA